MNAPSSDLAIKRHAHRYGILRAPIGSSHQVVCSDGEKRIFEVRPRSSHPKAKAEHRCLTCSKTAATEQELRTKHGDPRRLEAALERHIFVQWSEDPLKVEPTIPGAAVDPKGAIVGLLASDE